MKRKICIYFMLKVILLSLEIMSTSQLVPVVLVGGDGGGNYKCIDKERQALLHFKAHIQEDPYGRLSTWTPEKEDDCCKWNGVTCHNRTGHVTEVDLAGYNLKGEISPSLVNLTYLTHLNLCYNSLFNGSIPSFIGSMTQLTQLTLCHNFLNGTIPSFIGSMTQLTHLNLRGNFFNGTIPSFIGSMTKLRHLDLSFDHFNGSIPSFIGSMTKLRYLDLSYNHFNGSIPSFIGSMTQLTHLDLYSNHFNGNIPSFIGSMTQLTSLHLGDNHFHGTIPPEFGNLTNLQSLSLQDLVGCTIENLDWISHLSQLQELHMSGTSLAKANHWVNVISSLPKLSFLTLRGCELSQVMHPYSSSLNSSSSSSIVSLSLERNNLNWAIIDLSSNNIYSPIPNVPSTLEVLDLSRNRFYGGISFLCHITGGFLSFLDLSNNSLTGPIPNCLWRFKELKVLNLQYNNLSGRLPNSVESLIKLEVLYLNNNNMSGELPLSLQNCTNLNFLHLGANKFSGYVPFWIGEKLTGLFALSLVSNNLFGSIPSEVCQLVNLQILDLSKNNLNGTIPACVNNFTAMVQDRSSDAQNVHLYTWGKQSHSGAFFIAGYVDHAMMMWQGVLRELSSTLKYAKIIDLSSNNLTGRIPDELTGLYQLVHLNLSNNALLGKIPQKIGGMKNLQVLDISRNNLSAEIPSSMSEMTLLDYLDVSCNNLSGRIPSSTQLQSFQPSSYSGNVGLCGPPLTKYCPGDKGIEAPHVTGESEDDGQGVDELERWFYIGGTVGFAIGFWIVCSSLLLNRCGRHAFFRFMDSLEDWVYVKVMVFIAKLQWVAQT